MNDLGITKAEARAALRGLQQGGIIRGGVMESFNTLGRGITGDDWFDIEGGDILGEQVRTALALVASIGGAVDGRGRAT